MSWTPTFWMIEKDFQEVKEKLFELNDDNTSVRFWKFRIAFTDGVVIHGGDISATHREIHDVIQNYDHWILNGEGSCCEDVGEWEEEIDEFTLL